MVMVAGYGLETGLSFAALAAASVPHRALVQMVA